MAESFSERVYAAVRRIPYGKVATYGQIAALAGSPNAQRAVGNALHHNPDPEHTPCFRVVNAEGKLTGAFAFGGIHVQEEKLKAEGVEVVNFTVDLSRFQWNSFTEESPMSLYETRKRLEGASS